ncbi:nitronate monooxygenase [Amycolatopsis pithecellobii]|uniref:Propionate 3-nitronate monooxygenase n=1 Tax=Amycolatopsis pithecellobii TaxID=664692 RepID=A0A6N7YYT6_9PSEU|nr:nitronate monooxygenase [Amycolatopsis pithecellobii]MTD58247.1 nitronate monooxygenase [Amycolatopsis pithecellobii]
MHRMFTGLGFSVPVLAAPMAGGPTTPRLVAAAAEAGSAGLLAGGYKPTETLAREITEVRGASIPFGVNLFAPNPVPIDEVTYQRYARKLQPEADPYGIDLASIPRTEDDDRWRDKIDLLLADPVPLVTFTFGLPDRAVITALRGAGTLTGQTVTAPGEARQAAEAGVDFLAVQGIAAGGHSGTFTPDRLPADIPLTELVREVRAVTELPVIAAGGIATAGVVTEVLEAGASAVAVGTVLLRSEESAASQTHRAALADPARDRTVLTRAFTGRPARGLDNTFIERYEDVAPLGYPAVHYLTSPMRKAAAAAGDADRVHLWAGTGYRHATAEPAAKILGRLASKL